MKTRHFAAVALAAGLTIGTLAQTAQDNRQAEQGQAKVDQTANHEAAKLSHGADKKAYKSAEHADKLDAKALGSHRAKKAAKAQDKADAKAADAGLPR